MKLFSATKVLLLTALIVASLSVKARAFYYYCIDPTCCKLCGNEPLQEFTSRECDIGTQAVCYVTRCDNYHYGCGYPSVFGQNFNDSCVDGYQWCLDF
jgi:hypothetical protein